MTAAAESLLRPRPQPLLPFLVVSVAGHLLFIGAALVLSWALAGPRIELDQEPIKASLVRLGKKRDEKLLPRKEEAPPPPPPAAAPVLPTEAPVKPAAPTKPTPQRVDTKKSLFDAMNKTASAAAEAPEGDEQGDPNGDAARQEGERYYGVLSSAVRRNYDVSNTIPEAERRTLKARVTVRLGSLGELLDVSLSKSSGNQLFDDAVLGAVKKAAPFGPPPEHLRDTLKSGGVTLVFSP